MTACALPVLHKVRLVPTGFVRVVATLEELVFRVSSRRHIGDQVEDFIFRQLVEKSFWHDRNR